MNLIEAYRAYCENRAENIARMREELDDFPHINAVSFNPAEVSPASEIRFTGYF